MSQIPAIKSRRRRTIVPIVLGCCPHEPRCVLCPEAAEVPGVDTIAALVEHYRNDRARPDDLLSVGFFGGMAPTTNMLDAIDELPFTARVRPDLLTRAIAAELVERGAIGIELDVSTFDDFVLRWAGRPYTSARVIEMASGLRDLGVRVGAVLTPGLPGTDFQTAVRDATTASAHFDTARIQPTLVLEGSRLHEMYEGGRYTALSVDAAVAICREMMEILEAQAVEVIRVGAQPGPDAMGRLIAGPYHSSLRELVESKRAQDAIRRHIDALDSPTAILIRCAAGDETRARGSANANIRIFRVEFGLQRVEVQADANLERGQWLVEKTA